MQQVKVNVIAFVFLSLLGGQSMAQSVTHSEAEIAALKAQLVSLADTFVGQGDPTREKQKQLEVLVERLLAVAPQPSIQQRLEFLVGAWRQVWGPYDYDSDDRGVDPSIDPLNIYQVIFRDGYYYNVSPDPREQDPRKRKTSLLRGEFAFDQTDLDAINVQFTNLRSFKGCLPSGVSFIDLPALSESRQLKGQKTVLPGFFVRWTFSKGTLREVYTDSDLRIAFGSSRDDKLNNYLYVLRRVSAQEAQPECSKPSR